MAKYYVVLLGGYPAIKQVDYQHWNRMMENYAHVQDIHHFGLEKEMDMYVMGAYWNIVLIKKG